MHYTYMGNFFTDIFNWKRYVPDEFTGTINGEPARFSLDRFNMGGKRSYYYSDTFDEYVDLYKTNFIVRNAIDKIAKMVSQANFYGKKDNDAIVNKLNNPNNKQSKQEFLKEYTVFLKSSGWTIIWKRWQSVGNLETLELINLNPDKISFTRSGNIKAEYENEVQNINIGDFIVFYDTIRRKDNKGVSVLKSLRSQIENIRDAQKAKGIQIENSGTTIVSPKQVNSANGTIDEGLDKPILNIPGQNGVIQPTQKDIIEDKLNNRGIENRVIVSSKGLDALNLAAGLNAFDFDAKNESDILSIYDGFGVPVELTPYGKNTTYDNKNIAELSLLQGEVMPLIDSLTNSLNSEFDKFGNALSSFDHLECMSVVEKRIQETNSNIINQVISLKDAGLIDENKAKEMLKDIIQ